MPSKDFLFDHHIVAGLYPLADQFATSKTTDYICLRDYRSIGFLIKTGNATSDTADGVVTLKAATSAAAAGATDIAFKYRVCASSTTVDTWGALTSATSSGFSMTAGDNYMYWIEVSAEDVQAALADADFVALKVTEVTDDPIVADITAILSEPRYPQPIPLTAIA